MESNNKIFIKFNTKFRYETLIDSVKLCKVKEIKSKFIRRNQ